MALKVYRYVHTETTDFFAPNVMERGGIASLIAPGASGSAPDNALSTVSYAGNPSGAVPVGVLWNDVVNYDLTRQHINFQRSEVQVNSKVNLIKLGTVVTNMTSGVVTVGQAYLGPFGTATNTNLSGTSKVGRFLTVADSDGYSKFEVVIA